MLSTKGLGYGKIEKTIYTTSIKVEQPGNKCPFFEGAWQHSLIEYSSIPREPIVLFLH